MENKQNIALKMHEEKKHTSKNSELISISNKSNDYKMDSNFDNQLKISNNEDIKMKDDNKIFGNDFTQCYLTNRDFCLKKIFCSRIKKMGNLYVYFFINNQPLFVFGNKYISFIIIYHVLLHLTFFLFRYYIMNQVDIGMKYSLSLLYIVSIILKLTEEEQKEYYLCEECNIYIKNEDKIEHCEECNLCVKKYDHHCYWTGKCITKRNILFFYGFAFSTLFYILWYFLIIIYWLLIKISKHSQKTKKYL